MHAEKAVAVATTVTKSTLDELSAPRVIARIQSDKQAAGATPDEVANVLANFLRIHKDEADKRWQQETMLRLVSRLVSSDRQMEALNLVAAIQDVQTRELAYELAGQEITARGHIVQVFEFAKSADIIPPEKVALLRGFIGSLPVE